MTPRGAENRTWFTRALRLVVDPVYYYLGMYGASGRPSQSKIMTIVGFAATVWGAVVLTLDVVSQPTPSAVELSAVCVLWPLIAALPHGLAGFRAWADSKAAPASFGALGEAAKAAAAEIVARRKAGDGTYEVT